MAPALQDILISNKMLYTNCAILNAPLSMVRISKYIHEPYHQEVVSVIKVALKINGGNFHFKEWQVERVYNQGKIY